VRPSLIALISVGLISCSSPAPILSAETIIYAKGMALDVQLPEVTADRAPIVVLVHGCCGDRRDLATLARALARRGAVTLNVDVHGARRGGGWPATYEDVICAVGEADHVAERLGGDHPLVIVAWSDGAMVGASVALGWKFVSDRVDRCSHAPTHAPSRFVGLAGFYGWSDEAAMSADAGAVAMWFGSSADGRTAGNPFEVIKVADPAPAVPVLRGRGDHDPLQGGGRAFHEALLARGLEASLVSIARAGQLDIIQPRSEAGWTALAVVAGTIGL